jgi:hypothetical protein
MTDTDTQDTRIQALINTAVDRELAGSRIAPPWDPALVPERRQATHPVTRWSVPVLAASVAALLVAGTVMAIGHDRDRRATPAAHSASPTPSAAPSVSRSVNPDLAAANRAYAEAVAGAREATEVAGVSVGPVSAKDAARFKDTGLISGGLNVIAPEPGKTYSFTLSYLAGPSNKPLAVLTTEVDNVVSGSCAEPFLARPNHAYLIHCRATWLAGAIGKATLTLRTPSGTESGSMNLTDPAANYTAALADAPEASTVAGVSDRPATTAERQRTADSVGSLTHPITDPEPGKSYPVTLLYVPSSAAPALAVLKLRLEGVAAGHCPKAFRVRPAHAYQISCQVTFLPGVRAWAFYDVTGPQGMERTGVGLFPS